MSFILKLIHAYLLLILGFVKISFCQPLKIGDTMPNIELMNIINYPHSTLNISNFKGKLVILDFWGHGCTACIESFPKLDSLQKEFKDKLQIIAVNSERKDSTEKFFAKRKKIKLPSIPFVTEDSLLQKLFPRNFLPWHVWIDSQAKVCHIISGYNTSAKNIDDFLRGRPTNLSDVQYISEIENKPLIAEGNGRWLDKIEYYSYISHCIPGRPVFNYTLSTIDNGLPNHISRNCQSILELFVSAFSENDKYNFDSRNTVVLKVKDTSKYVRPENIRDLDGWQEKNSYSYDLLIPPQRAKEVYKIMQQDIANFFGASGKVEKIITKCFALVRLNNFSKLKTKGGKSETNFFYETEDSILYMKNLPIQKLISHLKNLFHYKFKSVMPVIDHTDYIGNIDISINKKAFESMKILDIKRELKKNGLGLIEINLPTNVLVIREDNEK